MIYPMIKLKMTDYLKKIMLPICLVSTVSATICNILSRVIEVSDFSMLLVTVMIYEVINLFVVYFVGLQRSERQFVNHYIHEKILMAKFWTR